MTGCLPIGRVGCEDMLELIRLNHKKFSSILAKTFNSHIKVERFLYKAFCKRLLLSGEMVVYSCK